MNESIMHSIITLVFTFLTGSFVIKSVNSYAIKYKRQVFYIEFIRSIFLVFFILILLTFIPRNVEMLRTVGITVYFITVLFVFTLDAKRGLKFESFLRRFKRILIQNIVLICTAIPYSILLFYLFYDYNNLNLELKTRYAVYLIIGTLYFLSFSLYAVNVLEKFYFKSRIIKIVYKDKHDQSDTFDEIFENKTEYILFKTKRRDRQNSTIYETIIVSKDEVKKVHIINETETL